MRFGSRLFGRRAGLEPGALITDPSVRGRIELCRYGAEGLIEQRQVEIDELPLRAPDGVRDWIRVIGVRDTDLLNAVGDAYGIHPLVREDIQNTDRRASFESTEESLFVTIKKLTLGAAFPDVSVRTVSLLLTRTALISFHEITDPGSPEIVEALARSASLRQAGLDFLAYRIWDDAVDSWLIALEAAESAALELEEDVLFRYRDSLAADIHAFRKTMAWLRWTFRSHRDLRSWLDRNGARHFSDSTVPFLSDLADNAIRVVDFLDLFRDITEGLMALLMSMQSNRMNAVMKVLTVIATIFIPLSFIAGVYGMNFQLMPELAWRWGYPAALALMGLTAAGMLVYFKVKKWL